MPEDLDAVRAIPKEVWKKTDKQKIYGNGLIGYVRPEQNKKHPGTWHWTLMGNNKLVQHGWCDTKEAAMETTDKLASLMPPGWLDDKKKAALPDGADPVRPSAPSSQEEALEEFEERVVAGFAIGTVIGIGLVVLFVVGLLIYLLN